MPGPDILRLGASSPLSGQSGREAALESLLIGEAGGVSAGEVVACAIALDGSAIARLLVLLTLRLRVARARSILQRAGAVRVHHYAVLPTLDQPAIAYEIGTAAAVYADRHLRPRGNGGRLRAIIARIAGVDPSVGAVVVAGATA